MPEPRDSPQTIAEREKQFYDQEWKNTEVRRINARIRIPGVDSLKGKRILICACGTGVWPVAAAKDGAEVFAFDISETAIEKAQEMARFNEVEVRADVMDSHALEYPDDYFDVVYGQAILHHVDCGIAGAEIRRCLKPGGVAYFRENSDRNPILRFLRQTLYGKPGEVQKTSFLFFKRIGTSDEYPLTETEIDEFRRVFGSEHVKLFHPEFMFFQLLHTLAWRSRLGKKVTQAMDETTVAVLPFLRPYSFLMYVWMQKPGAS